MSEALTTKMIMFVKKLEDKQTDNDSKFCKKLKDIDKALQSEYTNTPSVEDCKTVKNCIFYIFTHYGTRIFLAMLLFSYFHLFLLAYLGYSEWTNIGF